MLYPLSYEGGDLSESGSEGGWPWWGGPFGLVSGSVVVAGLECSCATAHSVAAGAVGAGALSYPVC